MTSARWPVTGGDNSVERAVNNRGEIAGSSSTATGPHAFLYTDEVMIEINTLVDPALGWEFDAAHDINERGQILATGCNPDGCFGVRLDSVASVGDKS